MYVHMYVCSFSLSGSIEEEGPQSPPMEITQQPPISNEQVRVCMYTCMYVVSR
jgi:hypothetical protein